MRIRAIACAALSVVVAVSSGAAQVSGVVFNDRNTNGQRDVGEPGIAGVVVSNQHDAVSTDSLGAFRLSGVGTGVVFMSIPDGFRAIGPFWRPANAPAIAFGLTAAPAQDRPITRTAQSAHLPPQPRIALDLPASARVHTACSATPSRQ